MTSFAFAEYRVFQLEITSADTDGQKKVIRQVLSTLDPLQYRQYHHLPNDLDIQYTETWLCPENTSQRPFCPNPTPPPNPEATPP